MRKLILNVSILMIIFLLGASVSVTAMRCDRGRVLLINALEIVQPDLSLFSDSSKQSLLWSGSIPSGGVEEFFLQERRGENLILEGTNAATGQRFSQPSDYVVSVFPYGTYIYLIEPDGVRNFWHRKHERRVDRSTPLFFEIIRVGLQVVFYATRCADEDFWRWWTQ